MAAISDVDIAKLFTDAHTHYAFDTDKKISKDVLEKLTQLTLLPPTAFNCSPARLVFVQSNEAKEKLIKCSMEGNHDKMRSAAVVAIVCFDEAYLDKLTQTFPVYDVKGLLEGAGEGAINATKVRNGDLQGGYFMIAARALGLCVGPMSGFDNGAVDATFLSGTNWKSNFLVNLGYPVAPKSDDKPYTRMPRLSFEEAAKLV